MWGSDWVGVVEVLWRAATAAAGGAHHFMEGRALGRIPPREVAVERRRALELRCGGRESGGEPQRRRMGARGKPVRASPLRGMGGAP